jgi:hypothetical protein
MTLGAVRFSGLEDSIREFSPRCEITANGASWSARELGGAVSQGRAVLVAGRVRASRAVEPEVIC